MTYKNDLYISFPLTKDNTVALEWINSFSGFLSILLEKLLKRPVKIVLSDDKNSKEINESAIYIALFNTDSNNKKFQDEIRKIVTLCEMNLKNRFYKVFNTKISLDDFPDVLKPLFDYNFYTIDTETGKIIEFKELKGHLEEKLFWLKLVDLAYDIYNSLILLNKPKLTETKTDINKTVYLAETNEDQRINKDIIKRELLQYGFNVIPEKKLTINDKNLTEVINKNLSKACMSIHIISEDYSHSDAETNSICAIQNSLASKYYTELKKKGENNDFKRIIWISPDLNLKSEKQRNNIEKLKQNKEALYGAEVVQTPIELLKTIIHNRLDEKKEKIEKDITPILKLNNNEKSIYLIYDKTDTNKLKPVQDYFTKKKLYILNSDFNGTEYELLKQHKQKLISADIVFIYYNNNEEWLASKIKDIIKSPGFGRNKPFLSKVIYFNNSKQPTLNKFTNENFLILNDDKNFASKTLDAIITNL